MKEIWYILGRVVLGMGYYGRGYGYLMGGCGNKKNISC